jgi:CubicO group peptidase (beta-lactamase class C family)
MKTLASSNRLFVCAVALAAGLLSPAGSSTPHAQEPGRPSTQTAERQSPDTQLPDTALGRVAREWLDVINGGSEASVKSFVETRFSTNALRSQSAADYTALFLKLRQQSGGLEVVRVTPPGGEMPMVLLAKSRRGGHYARVMLGMDGRETGKLAGMGVSRGESPDAQGRNAWPERPLSEAEMVAEIKRQVELRAAEGRFSGVVLVAKDDKVLLQLARGMADQSSKTANRLDTKFHLASVGKMFTAVAVAQLVKAGKLSYTDTVAKLLPDYPNRKAAERITVHQLLTHSAGMGTFFESPGFDPRRLYRTPAEEVAVYQEEPLFFEPGARWRYSNAGYSLLGLIVERVSGESYLHYVRRHIFEPLGMRDTDTNEPGEAVRGASVLYKQADLDPLGMEPYVADTKVQTSHANGFGNGFSTAGDLFKFARAVRTGRLLGEEMTRTAVTAKVNVNPQATQRWGYGFAERTVNGETVRGHTGGGRADVEMLWESGYTVVVQTNATPPPASALSSEIINFITKQRSLRPHQAGARP